VATKNLLAGVQDSITDWTYSLVIILHGGEESSIIFLHQGSNVSSLGVLAVFEVYIFDLGEEKIKLALF
jgi:hypothetical protein